LRVALPRYQTPTFTFNGSFFWPSPSCHSSTVAAIRHALMSNVPTALLIFGEIDQLPSVGAWHRQRTGRGADSRWRLSLRASQMGEPKAVEARVLRKIWRREE
jgi:hypothetical protein